MLRGHFKSPRSPGISRVSSSGACNLAYRAQALSLEKLGVSIFIRGGGGGGAFNARHFFSTEMQPQLLAFRQIKMHAIPNYGTNSLAKLPVDVRKGEQTLSLVTGGQPVIDWHSRDISCKGLRMGLLRWCRF